MRIIDLFSGAGGLTFGFYYRIKQNKFVRNRKNSFVFANELDPFAAEALSDEKCIELRTSIINYYKAISNIQ